MKVQAVLQLQSGALLAPGGVHQPRWFQIDLPPSVLEAWSQSTDLEPQRHIKKIEGRRSCYLSVHLAQPHPRFAMVALYRQ